MSDIGKLLERNRIFRDRMDGIGIITQADALAYGITGPVGRSPGKAFFPSSPQRLMWRWALDPVCFSFHFAMKVTDLPCAQAISLAACL